MFCNLCFLIQYLDKKNKIHNFFKFMSYMSRPRAIKSRSIHTHFQHSTKQNYPHQTLPPPKDEHHPSSSPNHPQSRNQHASRERLPRPRSAHHISVKSCQRGHMGETSHFSSNLHPCRPWVQSFFLFSQKSLSATCKQLHFAAIRPNG